MSEENTSAVVPDATQKPVAPASAGENGAAPAAAAVEQTPEEKEKARVSGWEKRINQLTKTKHQLVSTLDEERRARQHLEERLAALEKGAPKAQETDEERIARLVDEQTSRKLAEAEAKRKHTEATTKAREVWFGKVDKFRSELPDFEDVVTNAGITVPTTVVKLITDSDVGPKLAYHLAQHPEEAASFIDGDDLGNLRKFLKLEMRFEQSATTETKPVSNAPKPVARPSTTGAQKSPSAMTMEEFAKMRNEQLRKKKG